MIPIWPDIKDPYLESHRTKAPLVLHRVLPHKKTTDGVVFYQFDEKWKNFIIFSSPSWRVDEGEGGPPEVGPHRAVLHCPGPAVKGASDIIIFSAKNGT